MARVVVVGAGPIGLYCALMLARSGNDVVVVDRDPGPPAVGDWQRRGVMQFRHPHFFRFVVRQTFVDTAPDLWDAVLAAGGVPALPPGAPEGLTGLQCRRSTFEAVLWAAATAQPSLTLRSGHAERVLVARGRAAGVVVDGGTVAADLVIDASGRSGRLGDDLRPPGAGGPCGFSYVSRMYRARRASDVAALDAPGLPMGQLYDGYLVIVFPQDAGTLSTLIVRATDDQELAQLRDADKFQAAMGAVPHLARWTDEDGFEPITEVMPGGGLTNTYRGQADLPGLVFVGDAVCTTNPMAGRGVSLGLQQARAMLDALDAGADDAAARLAAWCDQNIRPWYEDHVYWDATLLRRFRGEDLDLDARIPSDVICAAAQVDPEILPAAGPYMGMLAPPASLRSVEERARAVLRSGWRPPLGDGPTRDELVELIGAAPVPAA
jgi:2-polyprenyl-6-methoxyphenol hydroxylase-like FAD-dependent oxidoreductase